MNRRKFHFHNCSGGKFVIMYLNKEIPDLKDLEVPKNIPTEK